MTTPENRNALKTRRAAGRDQLAGLITRVAKIVWLVALEIIRIARTQDRGLLTNGDLQPTPENNAALLAVVGYGVFAGSGTRLITLLDQLYRFIPEVGPDLQKGNGLPLVSAWNSTLATRLHPERLQP